MHHFSGVDTASTCFSPHCLQNFALCGREVSQLMHFFTSEGSSIYCGVNDAEGVIADDSSLLCFNSFSDSIIFLSSSPGSFQPQFGQKLVPTPSSAPHFPQKLIFIMPLLSYFCLLTTPLQKVISISFSELIISVEYSIHASGASAIAIYSVTVPSLLFIFS